MQFDVTLYGEEAAKILTLDGGGHRLMPLSLGTCSSEPARKRLETTTALQLFPESFAPEAAMAGLWLYFSCSDEAHGIAQDVNSSEGSFWHGILHRQEPDASNAAYWFRKVGAHPAYPALLEEASAILKRQSASGLKLGSEWDPPAFIEYCEEAARHPGSADERAALEIQRAEWQLLFDFCARLRSRRKK